MEQRTFNKLGASVSILGFGCMRFPTADDGTIDPIRAQKMIDTAMAAGVNYYDTAYPYHGGQSEPFMASALAKYDRESYYLATKLPCWEVKTLDDAKRIFKLQLERLQTDYVDFYLLHALDRERWEAMKALGVLEYCDELKALGKIRYFGFSFHDAYPVFEDIARHRAWDFAQIQLNYMDTDDQAGLRGYDLLTELDIPVVIMEPVKGGSLANLPEDISANLRKLRPRASMASWAMRWVGSLPNVKVILSGMSNMEQVQDNLSTFTNFEPLNELENTAINEVAKALKKRVHNGCTGCDYCMPCPAGVNIPMNFRIWNTHGIYENTSSTLWKWNHEIENEAKADNCVECGQCQAACPQKISIVEDLKALSAELDALQN